MNTPPSIEQQTQCHTQSNDQMSSSISNYLSLESPSSSHDLNPVSSMDFGTVPSPSLLPSLTPIPTGTYNVQENDSQASSLPVENEATVAAQSSATSSSRKRKAAAEDKRIELYSDIYPELRPLWEADNIESERARLGDYLQRLTKLQLRCIVEKIGEPYSERTTQVLRETILAVWQSGRRLPTSEEGSTPKKHHSIASRGVAAASSSATALIPLQGRADTSMVRSLFAQFQQQPVTITRALSPVQPTPLKFLLGGMASKSLTISNKQVPLDCIVGTLVRLDAHPDTTRYELFVPDKTCADQLRANLLSLSVPADARSEMILPISTQALLWTCVAIVEQDFARNFSEGLIALRKAHELMSWVEVQNKSVVGYHLFQALFAQVESRLSSAYRVNKQYAQALEMSKAAHKRASQFLVDNTYRSLRASISGLYCSAIRWHWRSDIEHLTNAEMYARESVALYQGLDEPEKYLWALSELIKIFYARGDVESAEDLRKRLKIPNSGESEECSKLMLNRLSYEGMKECLQLEPANTPRLYIQAARFLGAAIDAATKAEEEPHGRGCRCALQAEHLRKSELWLESMYNPNVLALSGN